MRTAPATLALLGAGLPLASGAVLPSLVCALGNVLQYLTFSLSMPDSCSAEVKQQGEAFCSSYLAVPPATVVLSTTYPTVTATVLSTTTGTTTSTDLT